jgi:hypothetical protein
MGYSIVPVNLIVKSMRDNGYKNTAFALAELIDNSIQHGASRVDLICLETEQYVGVKNVFRISEIAVLDNGKGMDKTILRQALQFGNGTNLDADSQTGIGKFGMGLPSSSISQAKRVEVWTWQNGIKNAIYSYLDVDDITNGKMSEVPIPDQVAIPEKWLKICENIDSAGTLVVWSNLDKCLWKTGKTIIDHSEFIVGRMYRKFIHTGQTKIVASVIRDNNLESPEMQYELLPNDPMYLLTNTSVTKDLVAQGLEDPMFMKYGGDNGYERKYSIDFGDKTHEVFVRYSIATEKTRKGVSAGSKPHGKHAKENVGVSVVRAGRELDLDRSWVNTYDPRERWWGVEIEFSPGLDDVFGVTNNKQYAVNFREMGALDIERELKDRGQTMQEYKDELKADNDPKVYLLEIANDIKNQLSLIRNVIAAQAYKLEKPEKSEGRHDINDTEAEKQATLVTEARKEEGFIGQSEKNAEGKTPEEKKADIIADLIGNDVPEAEDFGQEIFSSDVLYQFVNANLETRAFFSVSPVGGKIIIKLNTNHPAYQQFVEVLSEDVDGTINVEDLLNRLIKARDGMKLLLMAWARYEDEQPDGKLKENVQDARVDWGRMAADFMRTN